MDMTPLPRLPLDCLLFLRLRLTFVCNEVYSSIIHHIILSNDSGFLSCFSSVCYLELNEIKQQI